MPDEKKAVEEFAEEMIGKRTKKRTAPEPTATRAVAAAQKREQQVSRGVSAPWRLHPDLAPAVRRAAEVEGVTQRELVEYILTKALQALATGKLKLPKEETGSIYSIQRLDVPSEFLE